MVVSRTTATTLTIVDRNEDERAIKVVAAVVVHEPPSQPRAVALLLFLSGGDNIAVCGMMISVEASSCQYSTVGDTVARRIRDKIIVQCGTS